MVLKKIVWEGVDWTCAAQHTDDRRALVSTIMNLRVQQKAENLLIS
jgi:hypothetical protein